MIFRGLELRLLWKGCDKHELSVAIKSWLGEGVIVVLCVGNSLRGDDAFGPITARFLRDLDIPVFDCSVSPEAYVGKVVSLGATHVIMVDGVQADCTLGTLFLFETDEPSVSLESCHRGSMSLITHFFRENGVRMVIVGAQVDSQGFGGPVSPEVVSAAKVAAQGIHLALCG